MSGIILSPKYGLNPTMPVCFFCGETKGEIALLGKIGKGKEDIEAPMNVLMDYEPCEKCKSIMKGNVTLIGVTSRPNKEGQMPISGEKYPTGAFAVVRPNVIDDMFNIPEEEKTVIKERGVVLTDPSVVEMLSKQGSNNQ